MKGVNHESPANITVSNYGDSGYIVFRRLQRSRRTAGGRSAAGNGYANPAGSTHCRANTKATDSDAYSTGSHTSIIPHHPTGPDFRASGGCSADTE